MGSPGLVQQIEPSYAQAMLLMGA
jgi:hypothetical protein